MHLFSQILSLGFILVFFFNHHILLFKLCVSLNLYTCHYEVKSKTLKHIYLYWQMGWDKDFCLPAKCSADLCWSDGLSTGSLPVRNTGDFGPGLGRSGSGDCWGCGLLPRGGQKNKCQIIKIHLVICLLVYLIWVSFLQFSWWGKKNPAFTLRVTPTSLCLVIFIDNCLRFPDRIYTFHYTVC